MRHGRGISDFLTRGPLQMLLPSASGIRLDLPKTKQKRSAEYAACMSFLLTCPFASAACLRLLVLACWHSGGKESFEGYVVSSYKRQLDKTAIFAMEAMRVDPAVARRVLKGTVWNLIGLLLRSTCTLLHSGVCM